MDLEKSINKAKRELERVQRTDLKTKKRYLVLSSSLAMIVVIGLWFFYLGFTLPQPTVEESEEVPADTEDSFFRTIGRGAKNIFKDLENLFMKLKGNISQVKEFTLEGGGVDFAPSEEPLPRAPLP